MTIDQAKLARIKSRLAADAKAEGVTEGPWIAKPKWPNYLGAVVEFDHDINNPLSCAVGVICHTVEKPDAAFIARARTLAPVLAARWLEEIEWLEVMIEDATYWEAFQTRLASIVNNWPEETL